MQMCLYDRPLERKVTGQVQFGLFCSCSQPGAHFLFKVMGVYFFCWDTLHGMYWIVLLQVLSVGMWYGNCICTMLPSVWKRLILTSIQWWECSVLQWGVTDVLINHSSTMVCSSLSSSFTSCLLWERCVICLIGIGWVELSASCRCRCVCNDRFF